MCMYMRAYVYKCACAMCTSSAHDFGFARLRRKIRSFVLRAAQQYGHASWAEGVNRSVEHVHTDIHAYAYAHARMLYSCAHLMCWHVYTPLCARACACLLPHSVAHTYLRNTSALLHIYRSRDPPKQFYMWCLTDVCEQKPPSYIRPHIALCSFRPKYWLLSMHR